MFNLPSPVAAPPWSGLFPSSVAMEMLEDRIIGLRIILNVPFNDY